MESILSPGSRECCFRLFEGDWSTCFLGHFQIHIKEEKKKAESLWQRLKVPAIRNSEERSAAELLPTCRFRDRIQSHIQSHSRNSETPWLISVLILELPVHCAQPFHVPIGIWKADLFLNGSQQSSHHLGHREKKLSSNSACKICRVFVGYTEDREVTAIFF